MDKVLVPLAVKKINDTYITPIHFAFETYIQKLVKYELEPIFVSSLFSQSMVDEVYKLCKGVLCMGGSDFDPARYGQTTHPETKPGDAKRDMLEIDLIKRVLADKKPFIGICRGCQALAIANGGTLHQHIPDIVFDERHTLPEEGNYNDLVEGKSTHSILIDKKSKIYSLLRRDTVQVTTAHHQAVNNPGKNLVISGRSPKGITEIIEHVDSTFFCFGIQSHPETEENGPLEPIFYSFSEIIKNKIY